MQDYPLTIPAGQTRTLDVAANFVHFHSCDNDVEIFVSPGRGGESGLRVGEQQRVREMASSWRFTNYSVTDVECIFKIGDGGFTSNRQSGLVSVLNLDDVISATEATEAAVGNAVGVLGDIYLSLTNPSASSAAARFSFTNSFDSVAAMVANTGEEVFSAAANVNGAVIWRSEYLAYAGGMSRTVLITKATAPTSVTDGTVLATAAYGTTGVMRMEMHTPIVVPAGVGLYFLSELATNAVYDHKCVLYSLL